MSSSPPTSERSALLKTLSSPSRPAHANLNGINVYESTLPGSAFNLTTPNSEVLERADTFIELEKKHHDNTALDMFSSLAISGNDLLSSPFYTLGITTLYAGPAAPLASLLAALLLFIFRNIYLESVGSLPVNGGSYNVLLNSGGKTGAAVASVFAVIAYIATGVVSAVEAVGYLQRALHIDPEEDPTFILRNAFFLLLFFCVLTNLGLSESANVAKLIFSVHLSTFTIFLVVGLLHILVNPSTLLNSLRHSPFPTIDAIREKAVGSTQTPDIIVEQKPGDLMTALFFGFSSAMLGCSGFETSCQFVEEMRDEGVFRDVLKWMGYGVMTFGPGLSLVSIGALGVEGVVNGKEVSLANTARVLGEWLGGISGGVIAEAILGYDAFFVLAGSVMTSYVGINGLVRRMAMDRCLPQFLLRKNSLTHTNSVILVGFFLLSSSQLVIFHADVVNLSGVYSFSFLSVLMIFAVGNLMLKVRRPSLKRTTVVSWPMNMVALIGVGTALLGNVVAKPDLMIWFFLYVLGIGIIVAIMFQRVNILRSLIYVLQSSEKAAKAGRGNKRKSIQGVLIKTLKKVKKTRYVFFLKRTNAYILNKAILYVRNNEQTDHLIVVNCYEGEVEKGEEENKMAEHVELLDEMYPKIMISLLRVNASFTPATIKWLSDELAIPTNAMFLACPDAEFKYKFSEMRGVRIVTY